MAADDYSDWFFQNPIRLALFYQYSFLISVFFEIISKNWFLKGVTGNIFNKSLTVDTKFLHAGSKQCKAIDFVPECKWF